MTRFPFATTIAVVALLAVPSVARSQLPEWRLAAEPEAEFGGFSADVDASLSELGGVRRMPDGRYVAGDPIAKHLQVFGPTGEWEQTIGREGQGPGEYEYVLEMHRCAPGELWVFDASARVHRYSDSLEFLGTERRSYPALGGRTAYEQACWPTGYEVVTGWGNFEQMKLGYFESRAPVLLLRDGEVVHDFGIWLSSERIGTATSDGSLGGSGPHPLGRKTCVAIGTRRVYIGDAEDPRISVFDLDGNPVGTLAWDGPPQEYSPAVVDRFVEIQMANAPEGRRAAWRRFYEDLPELDRLPAYDRIFVDTRDRVWVREYAPPGSRRARWVIFAEDREPLAALYMPREARIWDVVEDIVVYSVKDEFDVPVVRARRLLTS